MSERIIVVIQQTNVILKSSTIVHSMGSAVLTIERPQILLYFVNSMIPVTITTAI